MKYRAIILFVLALACNQQQNNEKISGHEMKDSADSKYPRIVDSLGVHPLFDKAKWALYCIYSDDTCLLKESYSVKPEKTFGSLELRFSELRQQKDTIEIDFYCYVNDTLRCVVTTMANDNRLATGVGYRKGSDSILFYISGTTMRYFWETGANGRYANPLQPEVLSYIRQNRDRLHPWFREEAKRKGILQ